MARAPKIGRNDACPCGSGKKYKRCHLAEDEAAARLGAGFHPAAANQPGAPAAPEARAQEALRARLRDFALMDDAEVMGWTQRLAPLVRPGGPLEAVRLPTEALVDAVTRHIDRFAQAEATDDPERALFGDDVEIDGPRPAAERLCDVVWPDLPGAAFFQLARQACIAVALDPASTDEAREASTFGLFTLLDEPADAYPPLMATLVFHGQLATLRGAAPAVDRALELLGAGPTPDPLAAAKAALGERGDETRQAIAAALKADIDAAVAWLSGPDAPPMLTGDQILGVMGVLMGGAEPPDRAAWAATATRAVAQLGVAEALRAGAPDALAEPLNTALRVDGLRVAAAVLQQADLQPLLRDPEEEDVLIAALGDGADGAAGRVAYAAWLSARGEAAAAARVTEAARALDAPQ